MRCDEFLQAIDAYLDDELSITDILRAHGHVLSCEVCRRALESEAMLHSLLAQDASREQAPGSLRERIIRRLAEGNNAPLRGTLSEVRHRPGPVASIPAVLVAGLLVGLLVLVPWLPGRRGPGDLVPLAAEVAAKHLLYGSGQGPALEIRTSDPSEMTRWAERRIGLALKLPQLEGAEDRLLGARVSSLADAPAVYLLYERGGRPISLFVTRSVPGASRGGAENVVDGVALHTAALRGVVLAWWEEEDEGRLYAAASRDASALREFASLCIRTGEAEKPD